MALRIALITAAVLLVYVTCIQAAPAPETQDMPATLERITGNKVLSYCIFGVLAFLAVLLVFRGIRAR